MTSATDLPAKSLWQQYESIIALMLTTRFNIPHLLISAFSCSIHPTGSPAVFALYWKTVDEVL